MAYQIKDMEDLQSQLSAAGDNLVVLCVWRGSCLMIRAALLPKFEQMAREMSNVVFLKVDGDEAEDAAEKYNISAFLTFVFLKKGQKIADLVGAHTDELTELVNKHA